jgi:hypothetical protein
MSHGSWAREASPGTREIGAPSAAEIIPLSAPHRRMPSSLLHATLCRKPLHLQSRLGATCPAREQASGLETGFWHWCRRTRCELPEPSGAQRSTQHGFKPHFCAPSCAYLPSFIRACLYQEDPVRAYSPSTSCLFILPSTLRQQTSGRRLTRNCTSSSITDLCYHRRGS